MKLTKILAVAATLFLLNGCSSLTGLGGTSSLSCPRPDGTTCKPITEVYQDKPGNTQSASVAITSSSTIDDSMVTKKPPVSIAMARTSSVADSANKASGPLRTPPRVLRVWIAPFEDSDGDLYEDMRVYLHLDAGRWTIEHQRDRATRAYTPIKAPTKQAGSPTVSSPSGALNNSGSGVTAIEGFGKAMGEGEKNVQ